MRKIGVFQRLGPLLLALVLLLSACSVGLDTQTDVNKEFAGTKTITISINKSSFDSIKGGKDALVSYMEKCSKDPISVTLLDENDEGIRFQAQYSFVNLDDYVNKSQQIINFSKGNVEAKKQATASYLSEDSMYSKGYQYNDNIDSSTLLQYIFDGMKEEGLIENSVDLSANCKYKVTIDGQVIAENVSGTPIKKDKMDFLGPNEISIISYAGTDGNWSRTFVLQFKKKDAMDNKSSGWVEAIEKATGLKALAEVKDDDYSKTYTFVAENQELEKLAELTGKFLNCQDEINMNFAMNDDGNIQFSVNENLNNFAYEDKMSINYAFYPDQAGEKKVTDLGKADISIRGTLQNGENHFEKILPSSMEAIEVKSELKDNGSLSRELVITSGTDAVSSMTADMFENMLKDNSVKYDKTETGFKISYSGDDLAAKNPIFFHSNPNIHVEKQGMFKSRIFLEDSLQPKMNFKNFSATYKVPSSAKFISNNLNGDKVEGGYVLMELEITNTIKMLAIFGGGGLLALIVILAILKISKKKRAENPQRPGPQGPQGPGPQVFGPQTAGHQAGNQGSRQQAPQTPGPQGPQASGHQAGNQGQRPQWPQSPGSKADGPQAHQGYMGSHDSGADEDEFI